MVSIIGKWKSLTLVFSSVLVGCLVVGCASNTPQAQNFAKSQQKIAFAAQHWGMIATDVVEQTRVALGQHLSGGEKAVYVADNNTSEFSRAFRNYMIAGLVNAGVPVTDKSEGAVEITYETQLIRHRSRGEPFDPRENGYRPGMLSGGTAGYWVLRNASLGWIAATTSVIAGGYDVYRQGNPEPTSVELLLTISVVHNNRYLVRNTDAYYVEDVDVTLFDPCKGKSRRNCNKG